MPTISIHLLLVFLTAFLASIAVSPAYAGLGKIYHPYVEPLEKEIEIIATRSFDDLDQYRNAYTIGYGQSITEKIFVEFSVQADETAKNGFDVEAYELEALYQISDRGSSWIDYAFLVELERETRENISEIAGNLLLESELGQSSITTNLGLAYEFGTGIDNEYDRSARLQWRYRLQQTLEPALELYLDEYDKAAGPAVMGLLRLAPKQNIKWEVGLLFGLEEETPDTSIRAVFEFEF